LDVIDSAGNRDLKLAVLWFGYSEYFNRFSEEELVTLDGVMLEPVASPTPMIDPAAGPFLFDTSAESWLARGGKGTRSSAAIVIEGARL